MQNKKSSSRTRTAGIKLAIASVVGVGLANTTKAAITSYEDFSTTGSNHGFNLSSNYSPAVVPTTSTFVDVDGADTSLAYVGVYGGTITTSANASLSMGALVFDSVSGNTAYAIRSQTTTSGTSATPELDATLTLAGGNAGTTATAGPPAVAATAANDLFVLTSNLGGKTITLTGFGGADTGVLAGGTGNTSVAGANGANLIVAIPNSGNFDIASGNTLNFSNFLVTVAAGSKTYTSSVSGAGTITVTGGGALRMVNANSNFTGGFNVSGGSTFTVLGNFGSTLGAMPTSPSSPPQLTLNNGAFIISSTSGTNVLGVARQISLGNAGVNTMNQSTGFTAIAGQISGAGSLLKTGAGTIALASGINAYSGPTEVSQGGLMVDGSITASAGVNIDSGATLGGYGTTSAVNTSNGSIISPGDPNAYTSSAATGFTTTPSNSSPSPIGTLTVASLKMVAGSIFNYDIGSGIGDLLISTGPVTGDGGVFDLYATGTTTPIDAAGTYNLIQETGGYGSDLIGLTIGDLPSDMTATFGVGSNGDLQVTYTAVAVPEPTTAVAAIGVAALLLCRRRRVVL